MKRMCTLLLGAVLTLSMNAQRTELNDFGFRFYDKVQQIYALDQYEVENCIISPLSAQMALGMLMNGATGDVLKDFLNTLGISAYSTEEVNAYLKNLSETLTTASDSVRVELANAIWVDIDRTLQDQFKQVVTEYYNAEASTLDLFSEECLPVINGWANQKTHGLIPSIFNGPPCCKTILANALYFKGSWAAPFEEYFTEKKDFVCTNQSVVSAPMMWGVMDVPYAELDDYRVVELAYYSEPYGEFSLLVFLPKEVDNVSSITYDLYTEALQKLYYDWVELEFPKFSFELRYSLVEPWEAMGLPMDGYDGICDAIYFIRDAGQLVSFSVDEEGTEAAAITYIDVTECVDDVQEPSVFFHVDHNFQFVLCHRPTQTPLFIGHINTLEGEYRGEYNDVQPVSVAPRTGGVYDLSGRRINVNVNNSKLKKGIYIKDGKKTMVR